MLWTRVSILFDLSFTAIPKYVSAQSVLWNNKAGDSLTWPDPIYLQWNVKLKVTVWLLIKFEIWHYNFMERLLHNRSVCVTLSNVWPMVHVKEGRFLGAATVSKMTKWGQFLQR